MASAFASTTSGDIMAQLALQVMKAIERKKFMRQMLATREQDMRKHLAASGSSAENKFLTFSKSYFSSSKKIPIITPQIREILAKRLQHWRTGSSAFELSSKEENIILNVVDCFSMIHRGQDAVKRAIAQSLYYQEHPAFTYIRAFSDAYLRGEISESDDQPCYYILHGTVEVTYNRAIERNSDDQQEENESSNSPGQIFEPNVIYTHSVGEYMGFVSPIGPDHDFASPGTIYTTENCDLLCIDRRRFHQLMQAEKRRLKTEREDFIDELQEKMGRLPEKELHYLNEHFIEEKFEPNRVILKQGVRSEWLYFIREGRVRMFRQLPYKSQTQFTNYAPPPLVLVGQLDNGVAFAIESVVLKRNTEYHYVAVLATSVFKLHKSNFDVFNKQSALYQNLERSYQQLTQPLPTERSLADMYVTERKWLQYRRAASASVVSANKQISPRTAHVEPKCFKNLELLIDKQRKDRRLQVVHAGRSAESAQDRTMQQKSVHSDEISDSHRMAETRVWSNRFRMGYINQRLKHISSKKRSSSRSANRSAPPADSRSDSDSPDSSTQEDDEKPW